jgi:hypothetical protein
MDAAGSLVRAGLVYFVNEINRDEGSFVVSHALIERRRKHGAMADVHSGAWVSDYCNVLLATSDRKQTRLRY